MAVTLLDYVLYNNIPYSELKDDEDKEKLNRFVKKLEDEKLKDLILSFTPAHTYNIREFETGTIDVVTKLPDDLSHKMLRLWIHRDDLEFHL